MLCCLYINCTESLYVPEDWEDVPSEDDAGVSKKKNQTESKKRKKRGKLTCVNRGSRVCSYQLVLNIVLFSLTDDVLSEDDGSDFEDNTKAESNKPKNMKKKKKKKTKTNKKKGKFVICTHNTIEFYLTHLIGLISLSYHD